MENVMTTSDLTVEMDALLGEAQAFARGGDFLGAQARVHHAMSELNGRADQASPDPAIDGLRARVEVELKEYDLLAGAWQAQNATRHAAFLTRERQAIEPPNHRSNGEQAAPAKRWWFRSFLSWSAL
jgi:hypothetical protein